MPILFGNSSEHESPVYLNWVDWLGISANVVTILLGLITIVTLVLKWKQFLVFIDQLAIYFKTYRFKKIQDNLILLSQLNAYDKGNSKTRIRALLGELLGYLEMYEKEFSELKECREDVQQLLDIQPSQLTDPPKKRVESKIQVTLDNLIFGELRGRTEKRNP